MNFSVLLSVYEKESPIFLTECLDSVFSQTLRANEVILVEDGPLKPELYAVLDRYSGLYSELKIIKLDKNNGLGYALNIGLSFCSYDWVARMDTDDICKPNRFEKQIKFIEKHPEFDLVGTWVDEFYDNPNDVRTVRKVPEIHEEIYEYCKNRCPVNHPTVLFKKSSVLAVGGYNTLFFPEDYLLWIRMLMNGARFYNIPESLLFFRSSPDTIRRRGGWKYAIDEIHIQKRIYDLGFISFPLFVKNSAIRFLVRILPLSLRTFVYQKMLRSSAG